MAADDADERLNGSNMAVPNRGHALYVFALP